MADRFDTETLTAINDSEFVGIRAGDEHDFLAIWAVVADGRAYVRSYGLAARSWYAAFMDDPNGSVRVGSREVKVRAEAVTIEEDRSLADGAYERKYGGNAANRPYLVEMMREASRAETLELTPAAGEEGS